MTSLIRDPQGAAASSYDLLVVGGGFYGAMVTLEAARRGMSVLLVERDDFGGATSWNSLRIVHGGLRYLQSLDLARFRESVAERGWFLRHFPDLVEPIPCLMPLYTSPRGGRLRRPSIFRVALAANDLLSSDRHLPSGRLLDASATSDLFPDVDRKGLAGGALWHDAVMPDSQRVLIETLRWACLCGARVLNYTEVTGVRMEKGKISGLEAVDRETGERLELRGRNVINCAGPWVRRLAGQLDRDLPDLFRPVLAFNLLLDRQPLSTAALAVASARRGAQTWFLLPWKGRVLAGTFYVPIRGGIETGGLDDGHISAFLAELNAAVPGWSVRRGEVLRILQGRLPAEAEGSAAPSSRPVLHDHGRSGGPAGLFSVSGVKLTTARAVAEQALRKMFLARGERLPAPGRVERPAADPPLPLDELLRLASQNREAARSHLRGLVERQSVVHLEDLLLRRADWGLLPEGPVAARLCSALGWADARSSRDIADDEEPRVLRTAGKGGR